MKQTKKPNLIQWILSIHQLYLTDIFPINGKTF